MKSKKKKAFIRITKSLGIYKNIIWHATTDIEEKDIKAKLGKNMKVKIANNLTANYSNLIYDKNLEKVEGELKVVFISRIHPKKNLKKAIELLSEIEGEVTFNIYGPIEDEIYWEQCKDSISKLPNEVIVNYNGVINHDEIIEVFRKHHLFLFPTLGENFGHVISEALIGGCPVIISDQTPWTNLSKKNVGWDLNLKKEKDFIKVLQNNIEFNQSEYDFYSRSAFNYGKESSNNSVDLKNSLELFK